MKYLPYGRWKSPVSAEMVASRGRINTIRWDSIENQSGEKASVLFFSGNRDGIPFLYGWQPDRGLTDLSSGQRIGGTVGYGGGDFAVFGKKLVFMAGGEGVFLREGLAGISRRLTSGGLQTASPAISPDGSRVVFVASDGSHDQLALLSLADYDWPQRWIHGADFYMQPTWSPDGRVLAWAEWDHPNMAWDGSRVMLATLAPDGNEIQEIRRIAGGTELPASQPKFSPDGKTLSYIVTNGEWESLVLLDLASGETRELVRGDGFDLSMPAFAQGVQTYDWFADSDRIAFLKFTGVRTKLCVARVSDGSVQEIELADISAIDALAVAPQEDAIALVCAGPAMALQVMIYKSNQPLVIYRLSEREAFPEYLSTAQELSWEAADGTLVSGIYYPPKNPDYGWNGLPPAFVHIHGGPTGKTDLRYNAEIQYFTSRGFGWLAVNYRGSWGFGVSYRKRLNGYWGKYDVEDAIRGANCIGAMGLADRSRMLIIGGSAGGYTVLNALCRYPDSFKAGASLYGVSDLFGLVSDTHKLEAHYTDALVGVLPEDAAVYEAWSPLYHADKITAPLAVFQGGVDPVVPREQAEGLLARLKGPSVYRLYENEGHGFRQPETVRDYLETLTSFALHYL